MNINIHEQLGNYQLVQWLGAGGFSEVFLGEHLYLKTPAAIKVLHSRLFDNESLANFLKEARMVAQLDHPHIVRVLDFGVEEHVPYLVLQYAPNGTVRYRYPKGTRIPLPIIVQYVRQIAEALQYAHGLKIIHRDIKPENFLLGKDGEILLSDFGLAIPSQSSLGLRDSERAGTAEYMAPEQSQGKSSRASDQYALGVVVYEWLCGYPPFRGTDFEVLHQHVYGTPPPLYKMVPEMPEAIEQVVMRTLAKEPSERFPQVQDFALALEAAYHQAQAQLASVAEQEVSTSSSASEPSFSKQEAVDGGNTLVPPGSSGLEPSFSKQEVVDVLSQEQPQAPDDAWLTTASCDDSDDSHQQAGPTSDSAFLLDRAIPDVTGVTLAQQAERASNSGFLTPPSVSPEDQTSVNPAVPTGKSASTQSSKRQRRMTRRALVTTGILGLVALGGGGAAAASVLNAPKSTPTLPTLASTPSPLSTGTTAKSPGGGTTSGAGDPGNNSVDAPPSSNMGTTTTTTTMTQPPVQIANADALAQVATGSNVNVQVTTSQSGAIATVQVTYSNGILQTLGALTTNGNGNATFLWLVLPSVSLGSAQSSATLVASATGANGQIVNSAPVTARIVGGLG